MARPSSGLESTISNAPVQGTEATLASSGAGPARTPDYQTLALVPPDHYVMLGQLARGGMGSVMRARDRRLGREVAIKSLLRSSPDLAARLEREARITARLGHPSIVNVHEAGVWPGGEPFYAMELIAGRPLGQVIAAAGSLEERLALLPHVLAAADALAYAHSRRIIHRDLKPSNVLVGDFGETVVIDWGLAKDLGIADDPLDVADAGSLTGSAETIAGAILGTPAYMPPEQARGEVVDERADVYALGAMLYHLLAGVPPYTGTTSEQVIAAVLEGPPRSLVELVPSAPGDLLTIVDKAMAPAADRRYPSARELADDLRKFQTGQLVGAHRYSAWQLARRWLRRNRAVVTVAGAFLLVLAAVSISSVRQIVKERDVADAQRGLAEQHRHEAETRRTAAEQLVSYMVNELRDKLEPRGQLDALTGLGGAILAYYRSVGTDDASANADELASRAKALVVLGNVELAKKNYDAADQLFEASQQAGDQILKLDPGALEGRRARAVAFERMGTVAELAKGPEAARPWFEREAAEAEAVVAATPQRHEGDQRDLVVAYTKLGELAVAADHADRAVAWFDKGRALLEQLVHDFPANPQYARDLLLLWRKLGEAQSDRGSPGDARSAYDHAVRIGRSIVVKDPHDAEARTTLAITLFLLGDVDVDQGELDAALASNQEGMTLLTALAAESPDNLQLQEYLLVAHGRVGDVAALLARPDDALRSYRAALALATTLLAHAPSARARADVAFDAGKVAEAELVLGHFDAARAAFAQERAGYAGLVAEDASQIEWQVNLAKSLQGLGDAARLAGDARTALADQRDALDQLGRLAAGHTDDPTIAEAIVVGHQHAADALLALGEHAEALGERRTALAASEQLLAKDPTNATSRVHVAESAVALAAVTAGAEQTRARARARSLLEQLAAEHRLAPQHAALLKSIER